MSGINMFVGSAQTQADSIESMTQKEVQGYEAVLQSFEQFLSAEDLDSIAYENGKQFFSGVLTPMLQAGILVSEAVGKAAQKFVSDYQAKVDPGDLKSEELEEKISQLNTQIQHLDHLTQAIGQSDLSADIKRIGLKCQEIQKERLLNARDLLQETLTKLEEFHTESPEIFSGIAELEAAAKQGAAQAKASWNGSRFTKPKDLSWTSMVATKWKEYQDEKSENELRKLKERIEKEGLPATKAEILAEYHWSTSHNMYVHTKTGIPSPEVTRLYNKLVQAEHEPQQNQQLAFYNEMLRTGKHSITGKAITNADRINAKAMVYLLALEPFVGAWALAKYAQSLEVESGSYKKASGGKIPKDIDSRLSELVDDIRLNSNSEYPSGNVGAVVTDIDGVTPEIKSYSKYNNSTDASKLNHDYSYRFSEENRIFDTKKVNSDDIINGPNAYNRAVDTEAKMLEDIAHQLGYNGKAIDTTVTGNVYLVTERFPCASCADVINQFKEMFPNVNVVVKYTK